MAQAQQVRGVRSQPCSGPPVELGGERLAADGEAVGPALFALEQQGHAEGPQGAEPDRRGHLLTRGPVWRTARVQERASVAAERSVGYGSGRGRCDGTAPSCGTTGVPAALQVTARPLAPQWRGEG